MDETVLKVGIVATCDPSGAGSLIAFLDQTKSAYRY
jgi:hypothetical protein